MTREQVNPAEWEQLMDALDVALALPASQRRDYLERTFEANPKLLKEVLSLLEAEADAGFLDETSQSLLHQCQALASGERLGPYEVLDLLGAGGMGEVYLCERSDGAFHRKTAVKVLKRGMDTQSIVARFRRERRILADLNHPYIARLYDGGSCHDGRPWFAMEFVDGQPLDLWLVDRSLDECLALFSKICDAVHFAHGNLVVHRDLKPGNVMVDAEGNPKLLDFGIARVLDGSGESLTQTASHLLTPGFASPEQLRGETATTASDVYGLGLLLHHLLTGRSPFNLKGLSLAEVRRVVCEEPVPRLGPAARWRIPEDLDHVVLMALRKEPERRYASASHLAEDVARCRNHFPVLARGDAWTYRMSRFWKRHRTGVTACVGVALIAVIFTVSLAAQQQRTQRISHFLTDVFQVTDPWQSPGVDLDHRLLDQTAARMEQALKDEPELRRELQNTMGAAYLKLGAVRQAEPLLQQAYQARDSTQDPAALDALINLGRLALTDGDFETAVSRLKRAKSWPGLQHYPQQQALIHVSLAEAKAHLGELEDADQLLPENGDLTLLAEFHKKHGAFVKAEALYKQQLQKAQQIYGLAHPQVGAAMNNLAGLYYVQHRWGQAARFYSNALKVLQTALGETHPDVAATLHNLALTWEKQGLDEDAQRLYTQALAAREKTLGPNHPLVAQTLNQMAYLYLRRGCHGEAAACYERMLPIADLRLGSEHSQTHAILEALAQLNCELKNPWEAERYRRRLMRTTWDPARMIDHLGHLATLRMEQGDRQEGAELLRLAFTLAAETHGEQHPKTLMLENFLAGR